MSVAINGTNGITYNDGSLQPSAPVGRNLIINGNMAIDQRNAGASVTPAADGYTLDRWNVLISQASKFSVEQTISGVVAPVGFTDYLGCTSLSAYSVLTADYFTVRQAIEGFNIADLGWGTANAKTVTLSFWVRSSVTGTFGGSFQNSTSARSYPYTYTISSANTWEQKSVTIAGDTSGTWQTGNSTGIFIYFGLGVGSTFSGTAGAWAGSNFVSATGATSVVGTSGATFYITGVQLEANTTATPFENLQYGQQLALCQRYLPAFSGISNWFGYGIIVNSSALYSTVTYKVPTRVAPTGLVISSASHFRCGDFIATNNGVSAISISSAGTDTALLGVTSSAANLTAARPGTFYPSSASSLLYFTGCEL